MHKILLFIPMYNCEKQITRVLSQINDKIRQYISEIIVVNNRSTDNGEHVVIDYLKGHIKPALMGTTPLYDIIDDVVFTIMP